MVLVVNITSVMYTDISGYFWDYLFDAVFIVIGIIDFIKDPTWAKAGLLVLDISLTLLPFIPAVSSARHLNKVDDGIDAIKSIAAVDDFVDAGGVIRRANQADFTVDAWKTVNGLDNMNDFTKSSMTAGRKIHKGFMVRNGKEFIIPRGRLDFFDETAGIIYELKPYNMNGVRSGIKQLNRYNDLLGGSKKLILILY